MCDWDFPPIDVPSCFKLVRNVGNNGLLGKGGQACVFCFRDTRKDPFSDKEMGLVAIKLYPREKLRNPESRKKVLREAMNHKRINHKHIVNFREMRLTKNYLLLVLDYVRGMSLADLIRNDTGPLPEDLARWVFQQIITSVDCCHRMAIINRDISLDNILVDEDSFPMLNILMCDFGLSRSEGSIDAKGNLSYVGKKGYLAPEMIIRRYPLTSAFVKKGDIYSCGICLYKLLQGYEEWPLVYPCNDKQNIDTLESLVRSEGKLELEYKRPVSSACKELLSGMLHPNPKMRMTMADIMSNIWFKTDMPAPSPGQYNEVVCASDYVHLHESRLQSDLDLKNRIDLAGNSGFSPRDQWY